MSTIIDEQPVPALDRTFEPYNIKSRCPKCDHDVVRTKYHAQSFEDDNGCAELLCLFNGSEEHIERECARCGTIFFQEPLSLKKAAEGRYGPIDVLLEEPTEAR